MVEGGFAIPAEFNIGSSNLNLLYTTQNNLHLNAKEYFQARRTKPRKVCFVFDSTTFPIALEGRVIEAGPVQFHIQKPAEQEEPPKME